MRIVILGLSISSSWGNGHATNYRALVDEMTARGHDVLFCERDVPWYADNRDLAELPAGRLHLYRSLAELELGCAADVAAADLVIVGSYVPEGVEVAKFVLRTAGGATAFYDIDTPITLAKLAASDHEYLAPELIGMFDLYLSFTGGPTLTRLQEQYGARRALPFYCLVDPKRFAPVPVPVSWDLGYLGTHSPDRQPQLEMLLLEPARAWASGRFAVAGPQYPQEIVWPHNVQRIEHLPPAAHPGFYCAQRFTLNITRAAMRTAGWSPSVRLFEAAACATPVISDAWPGLSELFTPGEEILVANSAQEVSAILTDTPEARRLVIAQRARERVLREHTAAHRVDQLERELGVRREALGGPRGIPGGHAGRAGARRTEPRPTLDRKVRT